MMCYHGLVRRLPPVVSAMVLIFSFASVVAYGGPRTDEHTSLDFIVLNTDRPLYVRIHVETDPAAYRSFLKNLFDTADKNGDTKLSPTEQRSIPSPEKILNSGMFGYFGGELDNSSASRGKPDSEMTFDEFVAYFQKGGLRQVTLPRWPEYMVFADPTMETTDNTPQSLHQILFERLDRDRDRLLSHDELDQATQLLRQDFDDNDILTTNELRGQGGGGFGTDVYLEPFQPLVDRTVISTRSQSNKKIARRILKHYASDTEDALSQADVGLTDELFATLDTDDNGHLQLKELLRFTDRQPDIILTAAPSKDGQLLLSQDDTQVIGKQVDSGLFIELGDTTLILNYAHRAPQSSNLSESYTSFFTQLDQDMNGYLSKTEVGQLLSNVDFDAMDADQDGKLFQKEMLSYLDKMDQLRSDAESACVTLSVGRPSRHGPLFSSMDGNSDGRLTVRELQSVKHLVKRHDRNLDGLLSMHELPQTYQVTVTAGLPNIAAMEYQVAVNAAENRPPDDATASNAPQWFVSMDRNRDQDVSWHEFLGTRSVFDKMDTDGDGLLSAEEAKAGDAIVRN